MASSSCRRCRFCQPPMRRPLLRKGRIRQMALTRYHIHTPLIIRTTSPNSTNSYCVATSSFAAGRVPWRAPEPCRQDSNSNHSLPRPTFQRSILPSLCPRSSLFANYTFLCLFVFILHLSFICHSVVVKRLINVLITVTEPV